MGFQPVWGGLFLMQGGMYMVTSINRKTGARLKCFREEHGLSVEQVSKILGISETHYRRIERGEHEIGLQKLYDLNTILNIDPLFLLTGERRGEKRRLTPEIVGEDTLLKVAESSDYNRNTGRTVMSEPSGKTGKPIIFTSEHNKYPVFLEDILYLESVNRAVVVHTSNDILRVPSLRLSVFMEQYGRSFIRIHRTMIVNKAKIRRFDRYKSVIEISETGERLPVGRSYCEILRKAFDENTISVYNRKSFSH